MKIVLRTGEEIDALHLAYSREYEETQEFAKTASLDILQERMNTYMRRQARLDRVWDEVSRHQGDVLSRLEEIRADLTQLERLQATLLKGMHRAARDEEDHR